MGGATELHTEICRSFQHREPLRILDASVDPGHLDQRQQLEGQEGFRLDACVEQQVDQRGIASADRPGQRFPALFLRVPRAPPREGPSLPGPDRVRLARPARTSGRGLELHLRRLPSHTGSS